MPRFFREWGNLLLAPFIVLGKAAGMGKLLTALIPASAVTAVVAALAYWLVFPWWVLPVSLLVAFYLSLTAGMAWERSRGPSIKVGPLSLDEIRRIFYVVIENGELKPIHPRVYLTGVLDSAGRRLLRAHTQAFLGIWGMGGVPELPAGGNTTADLLRVTLAAGGPILEYFAISQWLNLHDGMPLEALGPLSLTITVAFSATDGTQGKPELRAFRMDPDPGSSCYYKVAAEPLAAKPTGATAAEFLSRLVERLCTTAERIFGVGKGKQKGK